MLLPFGGPQLLRADLRLPAGSGQRQDTARASDNRLPQFCVLSSEKCWSHALTGTGGPQAVELVPAHTYVPPSDGLRHLMLSEVCPPLQDMAPVSPNPHHHSVKTRVSHPAHGQPWTVDALCARAGPTPRSHEQPEVCRDGSTHHRNQHSLRDRLLPITRGARS